MTATYPHRFDAPQPLSASQERGLLTALGLGLLVTVLALAWAAVASRIEQSSPLSSPNDGTTVTHQGYVGNPQWVSEDSSF